MFDDSFEVFLADTAIGQSINKQIRYRVFCLEKNFEDPDTFIDQEETDHWDEHSVHFIVRDKTTNKWVASTRMIFAYQSDLPVEKHQLLMTGISEGMDKKSYGEISRFCLVGYDKVKTTHNKFQHIDSVKDQAQRFEVIQGLFRAIWQYGQNAGINRCYILITHAMKRILKHIGLQLYQVGHESEFKGKRTPFLVDFQESKYTMLKKSTDIKRMFARKHLAYQPLSRLDALDPLSISGQLPYDYEVID